MSLGQEIAPHLPFLRRFSRALAGSQAIGDAIVRRTLEKIVAQPDLIDRKPELRPELYKVLISSAQERDPADGFTGIHPTEPLLSERQFSQVPFDQRAALLLTGLEGFSLEDTASILGINADEISGLVEGALEDIRVPAEILLIEDEPIIAMDLETIARDLGHSITAVAISRKEAVEAARRKPPTLVIADIQLADDSSGIDAVRDIQSEMDVPVIFITAFPERLLTGTRPEPAFLITKPFQRSTVKAAIAQALLFGSATSRERPRDRLPLINQNSIQPMLGPIDARVDRGRLVLVDKTKPKTVTEQENIEAARKLHFRTAKHLADTLFGSNAAPRLNHRLSAIKRCLSRPLTQERSLQLGIQARGFEVMVAGVSETLDDGTLADLSIFSSDLLELVRQFPNYKAFVEEAASSVPLTPAAREALLSVARAFTTQDDALVEPELKVAVGEVEAVASELNDPAADLALVRTDGNLLRAIARSINKHAAAVRKEAGDTFDKTGGKAVGLALATLFFGTPIVGSLLLLQRALPAEFGFIAPLLRLAKLLLGIG